MIYRHFKYQDLSKPFSSNYKIKSNKYYASDMDDIKYLSDDADDLIDDIDDMIDDITDDLEDMFDDLSDDFLDVSGYSAPHIFNVCNRGSYQNVEKEKPKEKICPIKRFLDFVYRKRK